MQALQLGVKPAFLNSVCYLISYTRSFTKLNLFEILFYVNLLQ